MNTQQKQAALLAALSLLLCTSALAYTNAPTSQFGFKGWPYRPTQSVSAPTARPTATPGATVRPVLPAPTASMASQPTKAPEPTKKPAVSTASPSTDDDYTTGSITVQEENAFRLLNEDRAANGKAALTLDPVLCGLARMKSRDMNDKHYFAHLSPTCGTAAQLLKANGYAFTSVGENIAHHATVEKAHAAFLSSADHRRNMMGSQWSRVGIGIWLDKDGFVYETQLFVR